MKTISKTNRAVFFYITLFSVNMSEMLLELLASRIISPQFGNSNFVWTSVIGVILLSGIIGNIIGGRISVRDDKEILIAFLLMTGSIYIAILSAFSDVMVSLLKTYGTHTDADPVITAFLLFLFPTVVYGTTTPVITKEIFHLWENLNREEGKISSRIFAVISGGSLVGTFVGGFFLIPSFGTHKNLIMLSVVTGILGLIQIFGAGKAKSYKMLSTISFFAVSIIICSVGLDESKNEKSNDVQLPVSIDTQYSRITIEEGLYDDEKVRFYRSSDAFSSGTFTEKDKRYDLVFDYMKKYMEVVDRYPEGKTAYMIGGAAYGIPKYFISHYPDKSMDVVDIDPMAETIAKKYFYLDELIDDYGTDRLGIYAEDGRIFLENTDKKYDYIFNDAFSGHVPVATLATKEAALTVKEHLTNEGLYLFNVISAQEGKRGYFLSSEIKTLETVFDHVYCFRAYNGEDYDPRNDNNFIVVASDRNLDFVEDLVKIDMSEAEVFTDDYCPVEKYRN